MKDFSFKWFKNVKIGQPIERTVIVHARNAQDAVSVFMANLGNLKRNTIISIQEIDPLGEPIGEPIVPEN